MFQYDEKVNGQTAQLEKLFTWTQDAAGNADISSVKSASDQNNNPAT